VPLASGWFWVAEAVMNALAGTATPQGLVAVFAAPPPAALPPPAWSLVLDGVQDPGNVGALARCLFAFGGPGSLLLAGPDAAHAFAARALRASAGAAFHLRHERADRGLVAALAALPAVRVVLCPRGGVPLPEADLRPPLALVVGGEGGGVRPEVASLCRPVTIPLRPGAESLNVAAAAAVALYAAAVGGAR
jgi:TrmH family RNA methyltransferase